MRSLYGLFLTVTLLVVAVTFAVSLSAVTGLPPTAVRVQSQLDAILEINDTIKLTSGFVDWSRDSYKAQPTDFIEGGFSFGDYAREWLVEPDDLFLKMYESLNWTKVSPRYWCSNYSVGEAGMLVSSWESASRYQECHKFDNWTDFAEYVTRDPAWWLSWNWGFDCRRYGVPANSTIVDVALDGDRASITVMCHVTRVAEYLIARELRVGYIFDLRSVSLGKLQTYERTRDFTTTDQSHHYHFRAPADMLEEKGDFYVATIPIDAADQGRPSKYDRNIVIVMPSATEVTEATPTPVQIDGSKAIFTIAEGDQLPACFTVSSRFPQKTLIDQIIDNLGMLAGIGTVLTIIPGVIKGVSLYRRGKRYNRLMRLIVKLYYEYRSDHEALDKEMSNLTESIFTAFIDGKLTDGQLEKLLHRRDDLLSRLQPGPPP